MSFQNTTLASLQTQLAQKYEGQPFWTADQARRAINEGLRVYNLITGMYRESTSVPLVPDDPHVYVGGSLVKGTRVRILGRTLTLTSISALDRLVPNWQGVNTASGGSTPTQPVYWCPVGLTEIQIYPKIDPSLLGTNATIDGVRSTPLLVNPGDYLNMGDEEISALLGYALHVLCFAKGIDALARTKPMWVTFIRTCALRNASFAASSLYRKMIGYDRLRSSADIVDAGSLRQAGEVLGSISNPRPDGPAGEDA